MGLQNTAHYLKSKGRGRDTELVHMSKREIKGLQDLALAHGGSLTINPETGLVEAGFLEKILPLVAAAGLTYLTAGAAAPTLATALGGSTMAGGIAAGALSGAAISGGMAAIQGQDVGKAALMGGLGGGISGGLGAYADANVFNAPNLLADGTQKAVTDVGTQAVTEAGTQAATSPDVFSGLAGQPTVPPGTMPPALNVPTPVAPTQAGIDASQLTGQARIDALNRLDPSASAFGETTGINAEQAMFRAENVANPSQTGDIYRPITQDSIKAPISRSSYYGGLDNDKYAQKAAIQALPAFGLLQDEEQKPVPEEEESPLRRLSPDFKAYVPPQPNPYYREQYPTYASGGITQKAYLPKGDAGKFVDSDPATRGLSAMDAAQQRLKKLGARSGIKMAEMPKTGIKGLGGDFSDMAAAGGVAHLGDYSDGGRLLRGPGDGVSDNIPATIGGKQPARLADGEFVVPARIVSELGNGSTEAGAKRLYAMMDRVQKARKKTIGKGKIAKDSKSSKYLPA